MAKGADRLVGKWRILKTSTWDQAHLDMVGSAFIAVDAEDHGEMAFGTLEASLDCDFTPNGIDFDWNSADEGEQVCGDRWADLREDGFLEGKISCHNGDETTFIHLAMEGFFSNPLGVLSSAPCPTPQLAQFAEPQHHAGHSGTQKPLVER